MIWLNLLNLFDLEALQKSSKQLAIALCLSLCLLGVPTSAFATFATVQPKSNLEIISDRIDELKEFVDADNWITIGTYIHGPLGAIRTDISRAIRNLKQQAPAKAAAQKFYADLVRLDDAAIERDEDKVTDTYNQTRKDFDQLVSILKAAPTLR